MKKRVRQPLNLNLAPDVIAALRARSARADMPLSRVVDAIVRAHLGLSDPTKIEPAAR